VSAVEQKLEVGLNMQSEAAEAWHRSTSAVSAAGFDGVDHC